MSGAVPEILFYSLLLGTALGLVFTLLELLRILLSLGRGVTFLLDVLFGAVAAAASFILALAVSGGALRFYQFGCEVLGFCCIYLTVTGAVRCLLPRLIRVLERAAEKTRRRTDAVVRKILRKKTKRTPDEEKKSGFLKILSKKNEKKT